ncbi:hypothetical protein ATI45_0884 [Marinobacter sp. LV10MA510-1]|nr:hypothetical protein ATI45_0884 [Marinobacter sp. LV10MA510-1]
MSDGEAMAQATTHAKEIVLFFCTVLSFYQLTHSCWRDRLKNSKSLLVLCNKLFRLFIF